MMQPLKKKAKVYKRRLAKKKIWRCKRISRYLTSRGKARAMLEFSEDLLQKMKAGQINGKIIFLGQGMRPLFEATAALNNALGIVPKSRIRYFIYTRGSYPEQGSAAANMRKLRIIDGKTKDFLIVDYEGFGNIMPSFVHELSTATHSAKIDFLTQKQSTLRNTPRNVYGALWSSESVFRPAYITRQKRKGLGARRMETYEPQNDYLGLENRKARDEYLALQQAIKREVQRKTKTQ
jgi:hypothetical protein